MAKQTIGVDIDGVLNDIATSFVKLSNENFGTNFTRDDFSEDFMDVWKVDAVEVKRRLDILNKDNRWDKLTPIRHDAHAVLEKLKEKYRLAIVTSRPNYLIDFTKKWIDEKFPNIFEDFHAPGIFNPIDENSYKQTKVDICAKAGIDFLIDDQVKHCNAVAPCGTKALLFGDEPWNRSEEITDGVTRVKNWAEVEKYFAEIGNE
jgi:uncharacterized HAD superfamily protein